MVHQTDKTRITISEERLRLFGYAHHTARVDKLSTILMNAGFQTSIEHINDAGQPVSLFIVVQLNDDKLDTAFIQERFELLMKLTDGNID